MNSSKPSPDWIEYTDMMDVPLGLYYVAGRYKNDSEYVFTTIMHSSTDFVNHCVDLDFAEENKPEELEVEYVAELKMPEHPDLDEEKSFKENETIREVLDAANEFLMKYRSGDKEDCDTCLALLESLVDLLDEEYW